jgi:type VI secretion system protein ImpJ
MSHPPLAASADDGRAEVCTPADNLAALHAEMTALIDARVRVLAQRFDSKRGSVGEIADFMLLIALNPALAELRHLAALPQPDPERLYSALLRVHSAAATVLRSDRLAPALTPYDPVDCGPAFSSLAVGLRSLFATVMAAGARQLSVNHRNHGVYTVTFDADYSARIVLQVHSAMPAEAMRSRFPSQIKIGPVESIRDLVNLQLPGIAIKPLSVIPPQVPYNAAAVYFELQGADSALWKQSLSSGALALHVAGDFPELVMSAWLIGA